MLIVSDGRNTNAKGDDKRNRHRACGHAPRIEGHSQKVFGNQKSEHDGNPIKKEKHIR